jgi:hypothetical protein
VAKFGATSTLLVISQFKLPSRVVWILLTPKVNLDNEPENKQKSIFSTWVYNFYIYLPYFFYLVAHGLKDQTVNPQVANVEHKNLQVLDMHHNNAISKLYDLF